MQSRYDCMMAGASDKRFLVVFGSQTGQAKAIAGIIRDKALEKGLEPDLHCISYSEKKFDLEKERVVVAVVSTTGEGEPPESMRKFWRKLKRRTLPSDHLSDCNYALLGLGDTNYDNFCNMGKMFNKRLLELGATPFHPTGYADDAVGLEIVVEPWIEGLWTPLSNTLTTHTQGDESTPDILKDELQTNSTNLGHEDTQSSEPFDQKLVNVREKTTTVACKPTDMSALEQSEVTGSSLLVDTEMPSTSMEDQTQEKDVILKLAVDKIKLTTPSEVKASPEDVISFVKELTTPSLETLSLKLPTVPASFLDTQITASQTSIEFPFQKVPQGYNSTISMATIVGSRALTNPGSVKRTLELDISLQDCPEVTYEPGDALGFVCPNAANEVQWLLERLDLSFLSQHQMTCRVLPSTTKRNPILPTHIPSPCTVEQYLTNCVNIRCIPKKAFLCLLSNYCGKVEEGRRLKELASREGAMLYKQFFTELRMDFLDVLHFFPSCLPPFERLVENLQRLQPRHYSATSSPLEDSRKLRIAFNVETLPPRKWRENGFGTRRGLATGWYASIVDSLLPSTTVEVPIFARVQNPFRLPEIPFRPIIMLGPGTGVSPFIGFLNHLARQSQERKRRAWLFFGCRHPDLDYLYKQEIEGFQSSGVLTKLNVTYSRYPPRTPDNDQGSPRYIQDSMKLEWRELGTWIMEDDAVVYVCGDAVNISKDAQEALKEVISKYISEKFSGANPMSTLESSASDVIAKLKEDKRFLVDAWT